MRSTISCLVILFLLFLFPLPVYCAKKISIAGDKTLLHGDEEVTVTASVSGFTAGEKIYIKGAFFKTGSTNYFGLTKDGDGWIKNSAKTNTQRQITIGEWDESLVVKSDYSDSGFGGNGEYLLKVGFYSLASDGDPSSVSWSENSLPISLEKPPASPTPAPTTRPTAPSTQTPTLRPTVVPTIIVPTSTPQARFESTEISAQEPELEEGSSSAAEVLGTYDGIVRPTDSIAAVATPSVQLKSNRNTFLFLGLLCIGAAFILLSGALFVYTKSKNNI